MPVVDLFGRFVAEHDVVECQTRGVSPRQPPLLQRPVYFAHRGARAHAPENTIEAFRLARRLGATGMESDAWVTSDGVAVLDHDGIVGRVRRRPISALRRDQLPDHIPSLAEYYEACGTDIPLSLDIKDDDAMEAVLDVATAAGAREQLWICHPSSRFLSAWRDRATGVRLVNSTRLRNMSNGPERRLAQLRDLGIDALNLHRTEWTGGLTALTHRFERFALGWDAQHERMIEELVHIGIDGVFSDHVDRMANVARRAGHAED